DDGTFYDISEAGLPEACVIWELVVGNMRYSTATVEINLALGDVRPTTDAIFDGMEPLFRDIGTLVAGRRGFYTFRDARVTALWLRRFVPTGGRRLVGRFVWDTANTSNPFVILVVSAIPKEVPDWLISGPGRSPS
ncbi:unnamed protein product, partial [marine sediment metagenome]